MDMLEYIFELKMELGELMNLLKQDIKRVPILLIGFIFLSFGVVLTKKADLGMNAWGIFHQGLSLRLDISFGLTVLYFGLIILGLSVLILKTKIGIGTIMNVLIMGLMIDFTDNLFTYIPSSMLERVVVLLIGLITLTFGRSLYISARLGAGPRDGVFVGLSRITKVDVKYIKPGIEFTVLIIGVLLGGAIGFGTIFLIITSGYLIQYFFKLLHFDPKADLQGRLIDYLPKIKKGII